MKTPYLDDVIKRHEKALSINLLSDSGKEALNEFKVIKKALRIHDISVRSEQLKAFCQYCKNRQIEPKRFSWDEIVKDFQSL